MTTQTVTATMTETTPELTLTRYLEATPSRVFAALIDPAQLAQWFGPEGCTCPDAEADARVGGTYCIPIVGTDCSTHTVTGEYLEVVAPDRLVMTWAWIQDDGKPGSRMVVTITLTEKGNGTELILHQVDFVDHDVRDQHEFGWSSSFNKLEALVSA